MTDGPRPPRRRLVAIHQPNFFPWLGYFDKIARSDVFVLLDHVQFPKTGGGTWLNRVRLAVDGRPAWATMPVVRAHAGLRPVDEMLIDNRAPWRRKLLQLLRSSYGRAERYRETAPIIEPLVANPTDRLVEYNINAIAAICERLGLPAAHMVRSSELGVEGTKTALLVSIVKRVGGTAYLAGDGAGGYQDDALFRTSGIEVTYQGFQHPVYPQRGADGFVAGLSVLDAIFNCGFDATASLLQPAARAAEPS